MAHGAKLNALTHELVQCITGYDPATSAATLRTLKETTLKSLRTHRFGRTNQFAVQQNLDGILERCYVNNNEPLAEALGARLDELGEREEAAREGHASRLGVGARVKPIERELKWKPEILALLLALSDRPVEKSRVQHLKRIRPRTPPAEKLTWRDVVGEAELERDAEWATLGAGKDDASDDELSEESLSEVSEATGETRLSMFEDGDTRSDLESLIEETDTGVLDDIKQELAWRSAAVSASRPTQITEIQLIREILYALQGLPTTIFPRDAKSGTLTPRQGYVVPSLSSQLLSSLLASFATTATTVALLRTFTNQIHSLPLLQTFTSCIQGNLHTFRVHLNTIESSLAKPHGPTIASLLQLQHSVETAAAPLTALSAIVDTAERLSRERVYEVLDLLHDAASEAQLIGDDGVYEVLGSALHACLSTYLRPVRTWMETGAISADPLFFVVEDGENEDVATFWRSRFHLKRDDGPASETSTAPRFLSPFIDTIFAVGKEVAFRSALGLSVTHDQASPPTNIAPLPTFRELQHQDPARLMPFPDLLSAALGSWIQRLAAAQARSSSLTQHVLHSPSSAAPSLTATLAALASVYLSAGGAAFGAFAEGVFALLWPVRGAARTGRRRGWDVWDVEDVVRDAFAGVREVEAESLSASVTQQRNGWGARKPDESERSVKVLARMGVLYTLPPLHQNFILPPQTQIYQSAQTFLLQLHRATSVLSRLTLRHLHADAATNLTLSLRHTLLVHTTLVLSHLTSLIDSALASLRAALASATGIDGLIAAHASFVRRVQSGCLLVREVEGVRRAMLSLCDLCVLFAGGWEGADGAESERGRTEGDARGLEHSEESGDGGDGAVVGKGEAAAPRLEPQRLRLMHRQAVHLVELTVAGLRSASLGGRDGDGPDGVEVAAETTGDDGRVGWEMLAESLEMSAPGGRRSRG